MSFHSRRTLLSAIGLALPFNLGVRAGTIPVPAGAEPAIRFRSFEDALREAFARGVQASPSADEPASNLPFRRVAIGHSDLVHAGIQGCHNDRPFAGFPAGRLRIVRTRSEPGPVRQGVRLYVTSVDVALVEGSQGDASSRPLDFASLPPAPGLS